MHFKHPFDGMSLRIVITKEALSVSQTFVAQFECIVLTTFMVVAIGWVYNLPFSLLQRDKRETNCK